MKSMEKSGPRQGFVTHLEASNLDFYDATGDLEEIQEIDLPYIEDVSYVSMDSLERIEDEALGTSGIFHCVGIAVPGENGYLAHATPGKIGATVDELLSEPDENPDSVTYAVGGNPDIELFEEVRTNFEGYERVIYTGESGSIAVDETGDFYRVREQDAGIDLV